MRTLIINAGGKSERIKKDIPDIISKCWLEVEGVPVIIRNIRELRNYVQEILIVVKDEKMKQNFQIMFEKYDTERILENDYELIVDDESEFPDDHGPLLSIKTGVSKAKNDVIISIPSDTPFINSELFNMLENELDGNTIVSVQSDKYFNFLLFLANKRELLFLSSFTWRRVTDIFRLFPNCKFIHFPNKYSAILLGINTLDQYLEVKEKFGLLEKIELNKGLITTKIEIKRSFELNRKGILNHPQEFIVELEEVKCYLLLLKFYEKAEIKRKIQERKYYILESELWKEKNEIIYNHCIKDSLY